MSAPKCCSSTPSPSPKSPRAYAPEVGKWWDAYGPSNWGAVTEDTTAFIGVFDAQYLIKGEDNTRCILPGGLGCISYKLVEVLKPKNADRMISGATVVSVAQDCDAVRVTYLLGDKLTTVSAKLVLMCTPKFITSRLVAGLPTDQKQAMRRMRYAPFPMINMIFDKPVYRRGYDNWCPAIPSPTSSLPTGPFATIRIITPNTTSSPFTRRCANPSVPSFFRKTTAKHSPQKS